VKIGLVLPMGSHASEPEPWPVVRTFARRAEELGLDSLWVFEHVIFRFPGQPERGTLEAWTVLSMLGEATSRVELGSLVLGARFRNAALLAKMAVTLDDATGGRLTLGVGAGWHDPEYEAFGYPLDHRLGRTEETLALIRDLLDGKRVSREGRWVSAHDAVLLPPPSRRIPIMSSARGGRMMRIVARYADAWNGAWVARPDDQLLVARMAELDQACEEVGRDPATLVRTAGVAVRYPDADLPGPTGNREKDLMGEPAEIAAGLAAFAEAGYAHVMIWLEPMNERSVERLAAALDILRDGKAEGQAGPSSATKEG
jgi:alkanesulfonate monooxygenase SsuD/methylene tetrahydromethanopterin reductase-like flavin-dependent oxidoreductase (luciferase family)